MIAFHAIQVFISVKFLVIFRKAGKENNSQHLIHVNSYPAISVFTFEYWLVETTCMKSEALEHFTKVEEQIFFSLKLL